MPLRHLSYALQEPFTKELERLQEHKILAALGVDKMAEWCNTIIVPKPSGTVSFFLDPAMSNQVPVRPIHRGPTLNYILSKLTNACFMTIIDAKSGYHDLE